jgi:hypothetical protein
LMGGLLLVRVRRSLVPAVLTGAVLTAAPLLVMGPGAAQAWLVHSAGNLDYWQTWPSITYGIHGVLARLLIGGPWADPFVHAPAVSNALYGVIAASLVAIAAWVTRAASGADSWASFSTWSVLLVLLNPLAMPHNAVLLAWPLLETAMRLRESPHPGLRTAWGAALVLTSIPRQTLSGLVPLPASAASGLMVTALPCWGTLLLFGVACSLAHNDVAARRRWSSSPA